VWWDDEVVWKWIQLSNEEDVHRPTDRVYIIQFYKHVHNSNNIYTRRIKSNNIYPRGKKTVPTRVSIYIYMYIYSAIYTYLYYMYTYIWFILLLVGVHQWIVSRRCNGCVGTPRAIQHAYTLAHIHKRCSRVKGKTSFAYLKFLLYLIRETTHTHIHKRVHNIIV